MVYGQLITRVVSLCQSLKFLGLSSVLHVFWPPTAPKRIQGPYTWAHYAPACSPLRQDSMNPCIVPIRTSAEPLSLENCLIAKPCYRALDGSCSQREQVRAVGYEANRQGLGFSRTANYGHSVNLIKHFIRQYFLFTYLLPFKALN